MKTKPQPTTKRARPETMSEARRWERVKNRYADRGLCHKCAAQAAWGHQLGFSQTSHQPCPECAPIVATLPKPQPNGWRSVDGQATRQPRLPDSDDARHDSESATATVRVPANPHPAAAPEPLTGQPA